MNKKKYPSCFGVIDSVFPKKENGLRVSPESCIPCSHKTECLKTVVKIEIKLFSFFAPLFNKILYLEDQHRIPI